jgi:hypothetical protein
MRTLNNNEIDIVAGAGYGQDLSALAGGVYLYGQVATAVRLISYPLLATFLEGTALSIASLYTAALLPLAVGAHFLSQSPDMQKAFSDTAHKYFG